LYDAIPFLMNKIEKQIKAEPPLSKGGDKTGIVSFS
jgi:hypothetical protein